MSPFVSTPRDLWLLMVGVTCGVALWLLEQQVRRIRSRNEGRKR